MTHFDVIIASDLRFTGGTASAITHEIETLSENGVKIALLHISSGFLPGSLPHNARLAEAARRCGVPTIELGATHNAKMLVAAHPNVFRRVHRLGSRVRADLVVIVAHNVPCDNCGCLMFDPWAIQSACHRAFGGRIIWAPISPICRDRFERVGNALKVLSFDWINFIRVAHWARPVCPPDPSHIRIGRISRSDSEKFPSDAAELRAAYPTAPDILVSFLGYYDRIDDLLGARPENWRCLPFGSIDPLEFLKTIDFFVYFHNIAYTETFGRVIAEAIASGVVTILPHYFERTFGPAAIYCLPNQVETVVRHFHCAPARYVAQARLALEWLVAQYGEDVYVTRFRQLFDAVGRGTIDRLVTTIDTIEIGRMFALRSRYYMQKALAVTADRVKDVLR